jgi:hypothetical protein
MSTSLKATIEERLQQGSVSPMPTMVPNNNVNDVVNLENPQIPAIASLQMNLEETPPSIPSSKAPCEESSHVSIVTSPGSKRNSSSINKTYVKLPSWREIGMNATEPDFNIGILIDDITVIDRHLSAMSKPASRCFLTSVVVLNPPLDCEDEKHLQQSFQNWLKINKIDVDVGDLILGEGIGGYQNMLEQTDIDAVYIVLSPR